MKGAFFTLTVIILLIGCKSMEEVQAEQQSNGKRYAIGQGGGITGDYVEFILEEDGKVYKHDYKYDREFFYKNLDQADLIYFMEQIDNLGLEGIEMNHPGNMTYYIDVRLGKTSINKIIWGSYNFNAPEELKVLHQELFKKLSVFE